MFREANEFSMNARYGKKSKEMELNLDVIRQKQIPHMIFFY